MNLAPPSIDASVKSIYNEDDPIFEQPGTPYRAFVANGDYYNVEAAQIECQRVLKQLKLTASQLHGAQLFCLSSSGSLLNFTKYRGLVPESRRPNFVGLGKTNKFTKEWFKYRFRFGYQGYPKNGLLKFIDTDQALLTTWILGIPNYIVTHQFDRWSSWSLEKERKSLDGHIDDLKRIHKALEHLNPVFQKALNSSLASAIENSHFTDYIKVWENVLQILAQDYSYDQLRAEVETTLYLTNQNAISLNEYASLTKPEQELVSEGYPVFYGIRSDRKQVYQTANDNPLQGAIYLKDGASFEEIRVIFVPANKVDEVKNLLLSCGQGHIPIETLDFHQTG